MLYAIVGKNDIVVNIVVWDGDETWEPIEGYSVKCDDTCRIGSKIKNGVFLPPEKDDFIEV